MHVCTAKHMCQVSITFIIQALLCSQHTHGCNTPAPIMTFERFATQGQNVSLAFCRPVSLLISVSAAAGDSRGSLAAGSIGSC